MVAVAGVMKTLALASCLLSLCCTLVGCGSDDAASPGKTTGTTSGTGGSGTGGGGGGAGGGCEQGSHEGAAGCEAALTGWTTGPSLMEKRDHHTTFVAESEAGAFLYVLGGIQDNSNELSSVERALLAADGSVGPWASGQDLPEVMAGHMIATVDRTVVITGGYRKGPVLSNKSEVATILADGTLSPWVEGPKMSVGRFHHGMVAWKDSVYVVGGLTGNNTDSTPVVERAVVAADGSLGAWSALTPLPEQRSHFGLAVWEGALYLTAGLTGDPAGAHEDLKDVLRAAILDDGSIGDWTPAGELPAKLGTHASFAHLGYLYVLGGVENNSMNTDHVRRAPIGADGTVGVWEDTLPLPAAHAHAHQTPVHAGFVYSAGGALNHVSVGDVFVGRFE